MFNGSTSLRDAAGQLVEDVSKAVRRKKTVDGAYIDTLFKSVTDMYELNQPKGGEDTPRDLGPPADGVEGAAGEPAGRVGDIGGLCDCGEGEKEGVKAVQRLRDLRGRCIYGKTLHSFLLSQLSANYCFLIAVLTQHRNIFMNDLPCRISVH